MSPKVRQKVQASLFLGLAIFMVNCSGLQKGMPVWYKPSQPIENYNHQQAISHKKELDTVYVIVDQEPSYLGGTTAWQEHLRKNRQIPNQGKFRDRVTLSFDVTKVGEVVNIHILKSTNVDYSKEAIRLLITSGKWSPARQNGKAVNARTQIQIHF